MGETGMILGSGTQIGSTANAKKVDVAPAIREDVLTAYNVVDAQMFPVRVSKSKDQVVLVLDTQLLNKQRNIEETNESIRRRSRG